MEEEDEDAFAEDEDAFAEEEEANSNHVDFKEPQQIEPITFRQNMNVVESEPDQERPTGQQNGEPHFRESPFQTRGKQQSKKDKPDSETGTVIPEVHTVIPVDRINIPAGTTLENIPPAESAYPLHTPAEVTVPMTDDASELIIKPDVLEPQRQEPELKSTGEQRAPRGEPNVSRDTDTTYDGASKKTPTTPAQEIRFNIPFSGLDEPYVILDTQERSPEAVYEQDLKPEVKLTGETRAKTPGDIQHGKRNVFISGVSQKHRGLDSSSRIKSVGFIMFRL